MLFISYYLIIGLLVFVLAPGICEKYNLTNYELKKHLKDKDEKKAVDAGERNAPHDPEKARFTIIFLWPVIVIGLICAYVIIHKRD